MRIKLRNVLLVLGLVLLSPAGIYCAYAQDAGLPIPDSFQESEAERDRVIYSPGETGALMNSRNYSPTITRDSVAAKPVSAQAGNAPAEALKNSSKPPATSQDDDSVLSFNFLYYLFEKYKMQDIVD